MKAIKLLSLAFLLSGIAFGYSFWIPITFEDTPTDWASCTLGVQPGATDGFDFGVDGMAIPPFMSFGASFMPTGGGMLSLSKDLRSDTEPEHIWQAEFSNYTAPNIKATWLPTWVPSDSIRQMYIGYGMTLDTSIVWEEMHTIDSLIIPVGNFAFFKLVQDVEPPEPDTIPPIISNWFPADGDTVDTSLTMIYFDATDEAGLDTSMFNIHLWIDTLDIGFITTRTPIVDGIRVTYNTLLPFAAGTWVTAIAQVQDKALTPNITTDTIQFYVGGGGGSTDSLLTLTVQTMLTGFPPPTSLALTKIEIVELIISQMTDDMGQTIFDSLVSDTYTIIASRDDYFNAGATVVMTRDTMIMLVLTEDTTGGGGGNSISGNVSLVGASDYTGSILFLSSIMGDSSVSYDTTDVLGFYEFTGLIPGMYKLIATHSGYDPDSTFPMVFFGDTIIDFELDYGGAIDHDLLVIDWDNCDTLMPWGLGPAEWLFNRIPGHIDAGITTQDPDISSIDLSAINAIAFVTGNRLGTNTMPDDASIQAMINFVGGGGSIYWEGTDNARDYSTGSPVAQEFMALFGANFGAEGFSASTGNIEKIVLYRNFHPLVVGDTLDYAFRTEADHFVDELLVTDGDAIAVSHDGPAPTISPIRGVFNGIGSSARIISTFYLGAVDSSEAREAYWDEILFYLLEWTSIDEAQKPVSMETIRVEPNPFNSSCKITAPGPIEIYDLAGRLVSTHAGDGSIWNARTSEGLEFPSGMYLAITRNPRGRIIGGRSLSLVR
ncbi:hypothetical protein KAH81_04280 [bacterium]|nr:hypothetical protein [bacterium]